jgi:hypothetical protein
MICLRLYPAYSNSLEKRNPNARVLRPICRLLLRLKTSSGSGTAYYVTWVTSVAISQAVWRATRAAINVANVRVVLPSGLRIDFAIIALATSGDRAWRPG